MTEFYAHEGHYIEAEPTPFPSTIAFEGIPVQGWSGGEMFKTTDRVIQAIIEDNERRTPDVLMHFDADQGVLVLVEDGEITVITRDEDGFTACPGWSWGSPTDVEMVPRVVRMHEDDGALVTDSDRLAYLRRSLKFWIANLDANAATCDADGHEDTARRCRLDRAQLDDILGRIDGREDTYIASLKREGTL